jgi:hypothetical protein
MDLPQNQPATLITMLKLRGISFWSGFKNKIKTNYLLQLESIPALVVFQFSFIFIYCVTKIEDMGLGTASINYCELLLLLNFTSNLLIVGFW